MTYERKTIRGGHPKLIGYARVSTREQSLNLQVDALTKAGCGRIFGEKISSMVPRSGWCALMEQLRKGDSVVVYALDRIGRRMTEVLFSLEEIQKHGAHVRVLSSNLDTRSANGRAMLNIFAAFAECERELIAERTRAGLAAAKSRGKLPGRPAKLSPAQREQARHLRAQRYSIREIADALHVSPSTIQRGFAEDHDSKSDPRQLKLATT
jgi:DNA invertase Pin-like site-specific DNA recombinase